MYGGLVLFQISNFQGPVAMKKKNRQSSDLISEGKARTHRSSIVLGENIRGMLEPLKEYLDKACSEIVLCKCMGDNLLPAERRCANKNGANIDPGTLKHMLVRNGDGHF